MKIPAQLFVTQKAAYGGEYGLGFLNVYEPSKVAFEKKKTHNSNGHMTGVITLIPKLCM